MTTHISSLVNKRILVQGLGRFGGGVGVVRFLVQQGASVTVTDLDAADKLGESLAMLDDIKDRVVFKLGGHNVADFTTAELVVVNPAVDKARSEFVQAAIKAQVPLTTEMNLFLERCPAFTIGITGSVGKSTTTMLIFESIAAGLGDGQSPGGSTSEAGRDDQQRTRPAVFHGGNIGKSLLADLAFMKPSDIVVLELSSFMLEDTPRIQWSPNIAVITNLYPNHLDRHSTMAEYAAEKQNILRFQKPTDLAIINNDHDLVSRWSHLAKGRVVKYTTRGPRSSHLPLLMPGEHNQSNAQAALAVLDHLPVAVNGERALRAMQEYGGLEHRLQIVHAMELGGRTVRFYNDSKATSPDASITAIRAFSPGTAIFLAGGYDKHVDLSAYESALEKNAAGILGLGATGEAILGRIQNPVYASGRMTYAGTLESALPVALEWARRDENITAIVLSPASASWGQFANYTVRGERFATLARALA